MKVPALQNAKDIAEWVFSMRAVPKVFLLEKLQPVGTVTFHVHRQHRRRFKLPAIQAAMPMSVQAKLQFVSHEFLRSRCKTGDVVRIVWLPKDGEADEG